MLADLVSRSGMASEMPKLYKLGNDKYPDAYAILVAKATRRCSQGHDIEAGSSYYQIFEKSRAPVSGGSLGEGEAILNIKGTPIICKTTNICRTHRATL